MLKAMGMPFRDRPQQQAEKEGGAERQDCRLVTA